MCRLLLRRCIFNILKLKLCWIILWRIWMRQRPALALVPSAVSSCTPVRVQIQRGGILWIPSLFKTSRAVPAKRRRRRAQLLRRRRRSPPELMVALDRSATKLGGTMDRAVEKWIPR